MTNKDKKEITFSEQELKIRKSIIDLAISLSESGFLVRTWGNLSAKVDDKTIVITPTGRSYRGMQPEDLVKIKIETGAIRPGARYRPSSEAPMHRICYQLRPDVNYVIHTHQIFASAMSLSKWEIPLRPEEEDVFRTRSIPISPYALPGSKKLHRGVEQTLESNPSYAILIERHGTLLMGTSKEDVLKKAEALETLCKEQYERLTGHAGLVRTGLEYNDPLEKRIADSLELPEGTFTAVSTDEGLQRLERKTLRPYLDDFAQIVGVAVSDKISEANAFFAPDLSYAACTESTLEEAYFVRAVLEKNLKAAHIAAVYGLKPITHAEAFLMRQIYKKKYSKKYK